MSIIREPGLQAYWAFDADATGSAYDWSGNSLTLTKRIGTSIVAGGGRRRNALGCNGSTFAYTDTNIATSNTGLTVSLWVYFASLATTGTNADTIQTIAIKGLNGASANNLYAWTISHDPRTAQNRFNFNLANAAETAGSSAYVPNVSTAYATSTWYHLVGTWKPGTHLLYVDGRIPGSMANAGTMANDITTRSHTTRIGGGWRTDTSVPFRCLNGRVDEVRVYNRCLTSAEVRHLYQSNRLFRPQGVTGG